MTSEVFQFPQSILPLLSPNSHFSGGYKQETDDYKINRVNVKCYRTK